MDLGSTKTNFVHGLASPDCRPTVDHFLKETVLSFFSWLLEPVQCLGKTFLYLILYPVKQNMILGPDYMSRVGPVCRAASVC